MTLDDRLQSIFREIFEDENLVLTDDTSAGDIPQWDSFGHVNLMFSIEDAFGVHFSDSQLAELTNVGELRRFLHAHARAA